MSKKSLTLSAIQNMDTNMLDVILDDNKTYQGASKETFLHKLFYLFRDFKKSGDDFLLSYGGCCKSQDCTNRGCTGFSFVGNNSRKHLDMIFEETGDDYSDIHYCSHFVIDDVHVERGNPMWLNIYKDEEANFKPSIDFTIKNQKYIQAMDELYQYKDTIIDKQIYTPWLSKHFLLFKSFDLPPLFHTDECNFYSFYSSMNELYKYGLLHQDTNEALKEFYTIDIIHEPTLLKWLCKYEELGKTLVSFLYEDIELENPLNNDFFEVDNLKISMIDFESIAKFKLHFDNHYYKVRSL